MKTSKFDDLNDTFNVETDIVPAETTKVEKKEIKSNQMVIIFKKIMNIQEEIYTVL